MSVLWRATHYDADTMHHDEQFFVIYRTATGKTVYSLGNAGQAARWREVRAQRDGKTSRVTPIADGVAEENHVEDTPGVLSLSDVLDEIAD